MHEIWALLLIFLAASVVGYLIIRQVPTLLHTPLMSGTNAISGITIVGAMSATAVAVLAPSSTIGMIFGIIAIVLAAINVVGGYLVTDRMLGMFKKKGDNQK